MTNLSLRLYPANTVSNPYHVVYGSMAAQSDAMHKMILFASAQHLVQLGQLPKFAIQPYRAAMRQSFRDALQNQDEAWVLGVTVLLSIVFDVSTMIGSSTFNSVPGNPVNHEADHRNWHGWVELQTHWLSSVAYSGPLESKGGHEGRTAMRYSAVQLGRDDWSCSSEGPPTFSVFG